MKIYIFDKSYEFYNLAFEALARIHKYRVIIHEDKLKVSPAGQNGDIFTNTIDLLRQNDHYHLVKSRNKNIHQSQSNSIEKGKQIYFHNIFHN